MDGVEIHANIVGSILRGDRFQTVPAAPLWILVTALSLGLAVLLLSGRFWTGLVLWISAMAGWTGAAMVLFLRGQLVLLIGPLAVLSGSFWLGVFTLTLLERKRRLQIRALFASYVDPSVVTWLIRNPDRAHLDGERRVVTVLDTDIEGFTAITEETDPADLVKQLNRYFEALTEAALAEGGMLDKYVGDALMVIYGFPQDQPDHAERALRAAERICVRVDALNREWSVSGRPVFKTRIGICSGEVIIGSVGGTARKAVTAMGDAANLASRIEGLNKQLGTRVLLADSTARLLPSSVRLRDLGEAEIRGYHKRVHLHTPEFDAAPRTGS
jgi:adenylate cyclase